MTKIIDVYYNNIQNYFNSREKIDKKKRIISIDVLKGIAICLVILAHIASHVLLPEWKWLYYLLYMILDVFGPSLFVFLSCLGVIFSAKKRRNKKEEKKKQHAVINRAMGLFVLSMVANIVMTFENMRFLSFWMWGVIQFIAFGQIITYFSLKIPKYQRVLIAFLILVITPDIFYSLVNLMNNAGISFTSLHYYDLKNPAALIYWLLFYRADQVPILPWIAVPFIGSIVGESLVDAHNKHLNGDAEEYKKFNKNLIFEGILMIFIGIASGLQLYDQDLGLRILSGINTSPHIEWAGIPEFLIHSSVPNIIYSMGVALTLLSISFYVCEIRGTKGKYTQFFVFFGRFSLSLFLYHFIFFIGTKDSMGPISMFIFVFMIYLVLGFLLYYIYDKWNGIGTLEWLVVSLGGSKKIRKDIHEVRMKQKKQKNEEKQRKLEQKEK